MNRAHLGTALLAVLALTGCTSTDSSTASGSPTHNQSSPTAGQSSATAAQEEAPLILHGDGGRTCHTPSAAPDIAYFDVSWEATTDLDSLRFRLTNAHGVRQRVGDSFNVPPVNFGGRIDYSGSASWAQRAKVLDDRFLMWPQHGPMWTWAPIEDETGLAVLHLRVDPHAADGGAGGGFDGVTAVYRTADGTRGTATIDDPNVWRRHC